ncbi:MAG: universal stress protein [Bryobacteraceae bacterium]
MQPFRQVLVALACAESDRALLEYAAMIAGWDPGITFHLVHSLSSGSPAEESEVLSRMRAAIPGSLSTNGTSVGYSVLQGERLDTLLQYAATAKTDLILLGHSRNRSGRRSLARRLAMTAPCSVWLIPEGSRPRLERVLAPVDFSPRSADSLSVATSISAAAGMEECLGLHVRFNPAAVTFEEYQEIEMAEEQELFHLFLARIDLHGVSVTPVFEEGANVAATIDRVAEREDCDLIVMGTRGRSTAASVLLGSETEQIIIGSRRPVLAVKRFGARLRFLQVLLQDRLRHSGDYRFT